MLTPTFNRIIATLMTVFNARALASLATVAGSVLTDTKRLTAILNGFVKVLEEERDEELLAA